MKRSMDNEGKIRNRERTGAPLEVNTLFSHAHAAFPSALAHLWKSVTEVYFYVDGSLVFLRLLLTDPKLTHHKLNSSFQLFHCQWGHDSFTLFRKETLGSSPTLYPNYLLYLSDSIGLQVHCLYPGDTDAKSGLWQSITANFHFQSLSL